MSLKVYEAMVSDKVNKYLNVGVRSQVSRGLVAPDNGVTKPLPKVNSVSQALDVMAGLRDEQVSRQGGAALDSYFDTPGDTYRDRRYDFLKDKEGVRYFSYDDATGKQITDITKKKGLVTVGVGFNMDRADAREVWAKALPYLSFDDVYAGKRQLSGGEVRRLFDFTAQEAENVVNAKLKGTRIPEHQRLALVSLAFNNPSLLGPKLVAAVKAGDTSAALNEILHNSNRKKVKGLGTRRYHEAYVFAGDKAKAMLPDFTEYMRQFA